MNGKMDAAGAGSDQRYRDLFDCIADPLFVYDRETLAYLDVNDAAIEQYGYSREDFLGMTIKDIRPVEDIPALLETLSRSGAGQEARGLWRHQKRDGSIMVVEVFARGLDVDGRAACLIHARDVTRRVEAERVTAGVLMDLHRSQRLERIASTVGRLGGWSVEPGGTNVTWSDEVCRLHDVAAGSSPTFEAAIEYYAPEHRAEVVHAMTACAQLGTPFDLELEIVSAKGRRLWVRAIGEPVRDTAGQVVQIQGALQDISAIQQATESMRISEERFRLLAKATNDAVWDWDMITGAHWWNDGVEALFGYPREEIQPTIQFCRDRIHPADSEATDAIVNRAIENGAQSWSAEYRFRRRDGSYVWVLESGYILRDATGAPTRMIGGMKDLTERKRIEERMEEQAALLDEARDVIVVRDLDMRLTRLTYWNRSAERTYGWGEDDVQRRSALDQMYLDPVAVEAARRATLADGGWSGELQAKASGGKPILLESHWSLVRDKSGLPRAVLIISTNITEKRSLEVQSIRAQRTESIGTLASGIAHDLNNILAPILASIDLLKADLSGSDEALATLETLDICARRGADLVKQVLSFARGREGRRMPVDLARVTRELLAVLEDTLPKSIALRFDPTKDLWCVIGDSTQLHQVILNLCVNARDAMPAGGRLDVSMQNVVLDDTYAAMNVHARPGPHVVVEVTDTGAGIPPETLERIFDPFFTTKGIGSGTGLGLSTTMTIVKSHGGFINVHSEVGRGTKFKFYLPSNTTTSVATDVAVERPRLPRGDGELVLVVDDEEAIRKVVQRTLDRFGYRTLLASNGAEAVARYAQHRAEIAVALTDMAMPIMDGPATILAIKAIDPNAKIVGSSGLTDNRALAMVVGAGVEHFIPKPYTAEALLTTLRAALGKPVID